MKPNTYKNGQIIQQMDGEVLTYFFKNGKVKAQGRIVDGKMEGEWLFYRETGQLWQVGNFRGGMKHGRFVRYDRADAVEYDERFEENKLLKKS